MKAEVVVKMTPDLYQALRQLIRCASDYAWAADVTIQHRPSVDEAQRMLLNAAENYRYVSNIENP